MNVQDVTSRFQDVTSRLPAPPARLLHAVGLTPPQSALRAPSTWTAFGLGLLVGIGIGWLFQVTQELEGEADPREV